jgi:hypothetical protein
MGPPAPGWGFGSYKVGSADSIHGEPEVPCLDERSAVAPGTVITV